MSEPTQGIAPMLGGELEFHGEQVIVMNDEDSCNMLNIRQDCMGKGGDMNG